MTSKQFCSVCKQWLDMEVVPTGDGDDDDGVVWFRCPQCQGFLPKLSANLAGEEQAPADADAAPSAVADDPVPVDSPAGDAAPREDGDADLPWDSPADMIAARRTDAPDAPADAPPDLPDDLDALAAVLPDADAGDDDGDAAPDKDGGDAAAPAEPIAEYAAMLAALDVAEAAPYRPWETYEVGQCVHHLAWSDCGVVVAKESLPGGRHVIKCYFEDAGVVRLIERAER